MSEYLLVCLLIFEAFYEIISSNIINCSEFKRSVAKFICLICEDRVLTKDISTPEF